MRLTPQYIEVLELENFLYLVNEVKERWKMERSRAGLRFLTFVTRSPEEEGGQGTVRCRLQVQKLCASS